MNNELRKFKLIDKEGYVNSHPYNKEIIDKYLIGSEFVFEGRQYDEVSRVLVDTKQRFIILENEFKYFEEVTLAEHQTPSITSVQPTQDVFTDEVMNGIMDECKALSITVWVNKDGVTIYWLDEEYFVKNVSDYNKVVGAIKLLKSFS